MPKQNGPPACKGVAGRFEVRRAGFYAAAEVSPRVASGFMSRWFCE